MRIYDYDHPVIKELQDIWEPKKEYIDKDLWIIRNFLSQEEIDWIMSEAKKPDEWYITMRSIYNNVANKYLERFAEYDENGILVSQFDQNAPRKDIPYFKDTYGIENRLMAVVPRNFVGTTTLQSFFAVREDDEEMKALAAGPEQEDFSFPWHYEEDARHPETGAKMTGAFSLYLNDDFEGGELRFLNKPDIVIKPEPGLLVNVPTSKEFTHKVSFVKGGDRHTIYGNCWDDVDNYPMSSQADC